MRGNICKHLAVSYYKGCRYIRANYIVLSISTLFWVSLGFYCYHLYKLKLMLRELCKDEYRDCDICVLISYEKHSDWIGTVYLLAFWYLNSKKKGYAWYVFAIIGIIVFTILTFIPAVENALTSYLYNYPLK